MVFFGSGFVESESTKFDSLERLNSITRAVYDRQNELPGGKAFFGPQGQSS